MKVLWGRSGGRCAKCNGELIYRDAEGGSYLTGKQAHIVARKINGPRGTPSMPVDKRNTADNHILLCGSCHDEIDLNVAAWPPTRLRSMKAEHEDRIRRAGAQISTTEVTGTFDIEAVDAESVTGAEISSPTRLNGAHFKVRGRNVGHVTGVRIDVRG